MIANGSPCILITIPISPYCENARWAPDRAGIRYVERAHLRTTAPLWPRSSARL